MLKVGDIIEPDNLWGRGYNSVVKYLPYQKMLGLIPSTTTTQSKKKEKKEMLLLHNKNHSTLRFKPVVTNLPHAVLNAL